MPCQGPASRAVNTCFSVVLRPRSDASQGGGNLRPGGGNLKPGGGNLTPGGGNLKPVGANLKPVGPNLKSWGKESEARVQEFEASEALVMEDMDFSPVVHRQRALASGISGL